MNSTDFDLLILLGFCYIKIITLKRVQTKKGNIYFF